MRPLSSRRLLFSLNGALSIKIRPLQRLAQYGYCSVCDIKVTDIETNNTAKAVTSPPTPPADHRQLGVEQALFTTSIYSPGSPLFLPSGSRMFNKLVAFLRSQYIHFGFEEVRTPTIYKRSLWEKSGHWQNYAEDMFHVIGSRASGEKDEQQIGEKDEFSIKPMNCPGHCLLFASQLRSFRDLPIRYADFSALHRNEVSGALSGLTRVRRFHQDDGHIFCRPSQVAEEISRTLRFVELTYSTFNLGPYRLALSTRPKDNYIGAEEEWDSAEAALQQALDASGQTWSLNKGDGAFYGPKIDIILKDSDGKEHQTATIQLDFQLPKRFKLKYRAPAPELEQQGMTTTDPKLLAISGPVRPVMIHRAILGSVERFMALLIEHYNGRWPFWLNPRQIIVLTVSDDDSVVNFARNTIDEIQGGVPDESKPREMSKTSFAIDFDDSARSVGKKVSEAKRKRYGVIVVVGRKNVENGKSVTVNFSDVLGDNPILQQELDEMRKFTGQEDQLGEGSKAHSRVIDMEARQLRKLLLKLERAYV